MDVVRTERCWSPLCVCLCVVMWCSCCLLASLRRTKWPLMPQAKCSYVMGPGPDVSPCSSSFLLLFFLLSILMMFYIKLLNEISAPGLGSLSVAPLSLTFARFPPLVVVWGLQGGVLWWRSPFSQPILTLSSDSTRWPARATMTTTSRVPPEQHEGSADVNVKGSLIWLRQPFRSAKKTNAYWRTSTFSDNFGKKRLIELSSGAKGQSSTQWYALHYAKNYCPSKLWWIIYRLN